MLAFAPGMPHGGMQHGGHAMAPGHPSNQGVPGGGQAVAMGAQLHGGMGGGPGTPQPGQTVAMVVGMTQGAGVPGVAGPTGAPSQHALQHLTSQPQQLFNHQQQLQAMGHPTVDQQELQRQVQQQQRFLLQQQHVQQLRNGGIPMNPGMAPGQYATVHPPGGQVALPPHFQAQLQQQLQHQQHQQRQQAAQAAQAAQIQQQQLIAMQRSQQAMNNPNQPGQPQPMRPPSQTSGAPDPQAAALAAQQQAQQVQQAQHQAQQQAAQQQAQAQQALQQQQQQQQQQAAQQAQQQQQQQRDQQAAMQAQQQQQAQALQQQQQQQAAQQQQQQREAAQQAQQQAAQQQQQQQAQQQQAQQQQTTQAQDVPSQQAPRAAPAQQPAQQPQQTPVSQPQQGATQGQQQQVHQQAAQQAQQQAQQQQVQQQTQMIPHNLMMPQRVQNPLRGSSILLLLRFGDQLASFTAQRQPLLNNLSHWQTFVSRFFSQSGVLKQQLWCSTDNERKSYQVSNPVLARYYHTHFSSGVQNVQMIIEKANETDLPAGCHMVESSKSTFIYWLDNGCQLVTKGSLKAHFDQQGKIDVLDLQVSEHAEYLPRSKLQAASESPEQKPSPSMTKNANRRAAQNNKRPIPPETPSNPLPPSKINAWGTTDQVMSFLETAEIFSHMEHLFHFSNQHLELSPSDALKQLVHSFQNPQNPLALNSATMPPHFNQALQQQPPGQRTPGFMPNQFASPAAAHLNLPVNTTSASPATLNMSPAIHNQVLGNHQQAPTSVGMVAQQSQQGTNTSVGTGSQGTSANTSPNVTTKRRRSIKQEGDEGGGGGSGNAEVNGTSKVKQSPRGGVSKRQKGAS